MRAQICVFPLFNFLLQGGKETGDPVLAPGGQGRYYTNHVVSYHGQCKNICCQSEHQTKDYMRDYWTENVSPMLTKDNLYPWDPGSVKFRKCSGLRLRLFHCLVRHANVYINLGHKSRLLVPLRWSKHSRICFSIACLLVRDDWRTFRKHSRLSTFLFPLNLKITSVPFLLWSSVSTSCTLIPLQSTSYSFCKSP